MRFMFPPLVRILCTVVVLSALGFVTSAAAQTITGNPVIPKGFILVPNGSFLMGASDSDRDSWGDEKPQHQVTLSAYLIGQYDVTFDEYDAYCIATGRKAKPKDEKWGRDNRPVINVSWFDAVSYCNWLSKQEGLSPSYTINGTTVSCDFSANGYRLPTEAEWEYAAKGGQAANALAQNAFYAGSTNIEEVAWYANNSNGMTHPVGQKIPNSLGLFDMAGNVWQWCWDWRGAYSSDSQTDPTGADTGVARIQRGGAWKFDPTMLRSTIRAYSIPLTASGLLGFRLVRRP
ncbi:MAG: SUMF1/EgtB/PvdO family nonheme iron enzyme [Verrucomicrobiota bacterium]